MSPHLIKQSRHWRILRGNVMYLQPSIADNARLVYLPAPRQTFFHGFVDTRNDSAQLPLGYLLE